MNGGPGTYVFLVTRVPRLTCLTVRKSETIGPHQIRDIESQRCRKILMPSVATCFIRSGRLAKSAARPKVVPNYFTPQSPTPSITYLPAPPQTRPSPAIHVVDAQVHHPHRTRPAASPVRSCRRAVRLQPRSGLRQHPARSGSSTGYPHPVSALLRLAGR